MTEKEIIDRILQQRTILGISQKTLSIKSGFASNLISRIENHLQSPTLGTLLKILDQLELEVLIVNKEKKNV
jgi:predicted transcriptional regulator